jgi:hypothetical protein
MGVSSVHFIVSDIASVQMSPAHSARRLLEFQPYALCLHLDSVMLAMRLSCRMSTRTEAAARIALWQGTIDLLILRTLLFGPPHGQGIARAIQEQSRDALLVDHGSLYPALLRL